jgi:hypothetical protein
MLRDAFSSVVIRPFNSLYPHTAAATAPSSEIRFLKGIEIAESSETERE